jgi:hypothetical protein
MVRPDNRSPSLIERATEILHDEIANGALADVRAAGPKWSAHFRDLVAPRTPAHLAAEIGGLLGTVVDLLAPRPRTMDSASQRLGMAAPSRASEGAVSNGESMSVLRSRPVAPGGTAEIRTSLRNDGPTPVEVRFSSSDLVAQTDGRIPAYCLHPTPGLVRIPPDAVVDMTIVLDVPNGTSPGLYRGLLQATADGALCTLLAFPVQAEVFSSPGRDTSQNRRR